jgi:KDO2-lipid IV(A) lauroyltransferase
MARKRRPIGWAIEYVAFRVFCIIASAIGRHASFFVGYVLGSLFYFLGIKRKRRTIENIKLVYGERKSEREQRKLARTCYAFWGGSLAEFFSIAHKKPKRLPDMVRIDGEERLISALKNGKGVIAISGHISNFPLLGVYLARAGYPTTVLLLPARNPYAEVLLAEMRKRLELPTIYATSPTAMFSVMRSLRSNQIVWVLVDQKFHRGVVVDFLGHPAQVAGGTALFAIRSDAVVIPTILHRLKNSKYVIDVGEPIEVVKKDRMEEAIQVNMERFSRIIGEYVLLYPEQWTWFHNRWQIRWRKLRKRA